MVLVGCDPKQDEGSPKVEIKGVENGVLNFDKEDGTKTITMRANRDWRVSFNPTTANEWINMQNDGKATDEDGITLPISVKANTGFSREATVTFRAGTAKKTITVKQEGEKGENPNPGGIETISCADFIAKADTETEYRLIGTIVNTPGYNEKYWGFTMSDDGGVSTVDVVFYLDKETWGPKLTKGGKVTVTGKYSWYESKQLHQINKGTIEAFEAGEPEDPSKVEQITCAEFIQKADATTTYRLKGKVTSSVNTTYCSFDMSDDNGVSTVVVWTVNNKDDWKDIVKQNGTVTVRGTYLKYQKDENSPVKHEMVDAYIEAFEAGETEEPGDVKQISCAEFIQKADASTTYRLKGKVTSTVNTQYCSFDMSDDNGVSTVVVWTVNNKDDWKNVVKQGGTVTVRGKYFKYQKDETSPVKHEMVDAYIEEFVPGEGGEDPDPVDPSGAYESNVTWTKGTNAYDNTNEGNTNVSGTVNGEKVVKWLKLGKSAAGGDATVNVPAGTKTLSFYAVAWKGKTATLKVEMNGTTLFSEKPAANATATGNSPFSLTVAENDKYTITFESALTAATGLKFSTDSERCIVVGIKAE